MSKMYSFRLSDDDAEAFDKFCEERGLTASKVFQQAALSAIGKTMDDPEPGISAKRRKEPAAPAGIERTKGDSKHSTEPVVAVKPRRVVGYHPTSKEPIFG